MGTPGTPRVGRAERGDLRVGGPRLAGRGESLERRDLWDPCDLKVEHQGRRDPMDPQKPLDHL